MNAPLQPLALTGALLSVALVAGCDAGGASGVVCADDAGGNVALVDHDRWTVASAEDDPWVASRPAEDLCTDADHYAEDFAGTYSYAIQTGPRCGYVTVVQPSLAGACAGQTLYVWLWHFQLTAPDPGEAHVAVRIGDREVWAATLPIPSESGLFAEEIPLPADVPAGTPVYYHVDNHGSNSYNLLEVSLKAAPTR
ncbi:MAG: hypothetical protein EP329_18255 [Deltaproteobacteria bacterium]|nr:MAG: hypothetical protein EP329_18255 [Deltaproteobacteria bacterium]